MDIQQSLNIPSQSWEAWKGLTFERENARVESLGVAACRGCISYVGSCECADEVTQNTVDVLNQGV